MNELELIYNGWLIKFKYNNTIIVNSDDMEFYGFLIDSLKGKNKNCLINRREVEKNEFAVYEIDGSLTLADEFKYTSKSYALKRILECIEPKKEQYDLIADKINQDFEIIKSELNEFLGVETNDTAFELSILEIIKKLYNPVITEKLNNIDSEAIFYKNIFEYCNKSKSFVVVDLRKSKHNLSSILQVIDLVKGYDNVSLFLIENDINNLYNLSFSHDIYLSNLNYKDFNTSVASFEKDINLDNPIDIRILLLNFIILKSNGYEKYLKNEVLNKEMINFVDEFKNYFIREMC